MTTHEVLVAARNKLTREGWRKGEWCVGAKGGFCVDGALLDAARTMENYVPAAAALADHLGLDSIRDIPEWNDGASKHKVIAALDAVIIQTAPEPNTDFLNRASWRTPEAVS